MQYFFLPNRWHAVLAHQDVLEKHSMTITERLPCEKPDQPKTLQV